MMTDLKDFILSQLNESENLEESVEEVEVVESESIKNEDEFRAAAEAKFKEVFGDDLDKEQMKKTIDGILNDHKEDAEAGEWGKLIGILNKSFGK
jgi:hypothetical protein